MTLLKIKSNTKNGISGSFETTVNDLIKNQKKSQLAENIYVPKANIKENDKEFEIQLELTGYAKQDVEIHIKENLLTIQGNNKKEAGSSKFHIQQIHSGIFKRAFYLPEDILEEKIHAVIENGIMIINIPKELSKQIKKSIAVK